MSAEAVGFVCSVVVGLMFAENRVSRRHEMALRARGAVEPEGDPYRALALVYPLAFVAMGAEGWWRVASPGVATESLEPSWLAAGVLLFCASKALKFWAIGHLGERWSFRILVVPSAPLVNSGPYRYVRHPNYVAVFGELLAMMFMMSAWMTGPVATVAFAVVMWRRLQVEERALFGAGR